LWGIGREPPNSLTPYADDEEAISLSVFPRDGFSLLSPIFMLLRQAFIAARGGVPRPSSVQ
jgi:hypothetical protein